MKNSTVAIETLGCKLNQAESELLVGQFLEAGFRLVGPRDGADIYILNTCTVTHIADRKSRHLLRLARRQNPDALVVATGCYAERAPQELAQIGGIDLVIGNGGKPNLLQAVEGNSTCLSLKGKRISKPVRFRTRSFVKIQDGCNHFCSYCIVPSVRGREYSVPMGHVVEEIRARVASGYREVVLTGINIGTYGQDGAGLRHLLERILADTGVERLHLSSLQPQDVSPELLSLWRGGRLCRHFHLPLQSGSETVLRRMRRRYGLADYHRAVSLLRQAVPGVAVTTDIIVGFPGESDGEFEESYQFCREIGFAAMHIFPYSPREGTAAARMPGQVEGRVKKERGRRMAELARSSAHRFRERFLGRTMAVLWERELAGGVWSGLTDNYLRVFVSSDAPLTDQLLPVQLVGMHNQGLQGLLVLVPGLCYDATQEGQLTGVGEDDY